MAKQDYKIKSPNNEVVYTEPGKNGPDDMKIFTRFPKMPWPHSLWYIGACLRLKGLVEERNYPQPKGFRGRLMLIDFCRECIENLDVSITDICRKYRIPEREKK